MWRFLGILALCGSFGLLQPVCAAPLLRSFDYNDMSLTPREQLMYYSGKEFATLLNDTLIEGAALLQRVIDDVRATLPHYHSQLLDSYAKLIASSASLIELDELEDLMDEMIDMFQEPQLDADAEYVLDAAVTPERLIERLLRKHGLYSFEQRLEQKLNDAIHRIEQRIESYIKSLSPLKRKREAQMISWFQVFQAETDIEKKTDLLVDMFNLNEYDY